MATCRDIVTRALQQAGIVALGREPSAKEAEAGMLALQGLYDGWFASGMFGTLKDIDASGTYEANEGERVTGASSVTKPTRIADACSASRYRPPYELSAIVDVTAGANWLWIDGAWVNCSGLALGDAAPLSTRDSEGLSSLLASYFAEGFGGSIGPMTARRAAQFQGNVSHKFGSTQAPVEGDFF
jgi:hypothetical protein